MSNRRLVNLVKFQTLIDEQETVIHRAKTTKTCSFWSFLFCHTSHIFDVSFKRLIHENDLSEIPKSIASKNLTLSTFYDFYNNKKRLGIITFFLRRNRRAFCTAILLIFLHNLMLLLCLMGLRVFIDRLQQAEGSLEYFVIAGFMFMGGFTLYLVQGLILENGKAIAAKMATKIIQNVRLLIYDRVVSMKAEYRQVIFESTINSLLLVDAHALQTWLNLLPHLICSPFMLLISLGVILYQLGYQALASVLTILLVTIVLYFLNKRQVKLEGKLLEMDHKKNLILSEYLMQVRQIKLDGMTWLYKKKLLEVRALEIKAIHSKNTYLLLADILFHILPVLLSLSTFPVIYYRNGSLSTKDTFYTIAVFNIMRGPMEHIYKGLVQLPKLHNSLERLALFLEKVRLQEIVPILPSNSIIKGQVILRKCFFQYKNQSESQAVSHFLRNISSFTIKDFQEYVSKDEADHQSEQLILKNINLKIQPGQKICIVGDNHSGKQLLIKSILGELELSKGGMDKRGKIAYIPALPFMLNGTIRSNIVLSNIIKDSRLDSIIKYTLLRKSIKKLEKGVDSEIIEHGKNLTEVHRKKIGLARAACSVSDILLLDDVFSGIMPREAKVIFQTLMSNFFERTTVIYTSDNIEMLKRADKIVVMRNGRIQEVGTFSNLKANSNSLFYALFCLESEFKATKGKNSNKRSFKILTENSLSSLISIGKKSIENINSKNKADKQPVFSRRRRHNRFDTNQIITFEREKTMLKFQEKASIPGKRVLSFYFIQSNSLFFSLVIFSFLISIVILVVSDWWMGEWSRNTFNKQNPSINLIVYFAICCALGISMLIRNLILIRFTLRASKIMQKKLICSILEKDYLEISKISVGKIMNLVFKNHQDIDSELPLHLEQFFQSLFHLVASVVLLVYFSALVVVGVLICSLILSYYLYKYVKCNSQLYHIAAVRRMRLVSHISEAYNAMVELKSLRFLNPLQKMFYKTNDNYQNALRHYGSMSQQWIGIRISILTSVCLGYSISAIALQKYVSVTPGKYSLPLSMMWAIITISLLKKTAISLTKVGSSMVSVQSVMEFCLESKKDGLKLKNQSKGTANLKNAKILSGRGLYRSPRGSNIHVRVTEKKKSSLLGVPPKVKTFKVIKAIQELGELPSKKNTENKDLNSPLSSSSRSRNGPIIDIIELDVKFSGQNIDVMLDNFSLKINPKDKIAILGSTSSGKYLLFDTISKLYTNHTSKKFNIFGQQHSSLSKKDIDDKISYLRDRNTLFSGTLLENIDPNNEYSLDSILKVYSYLDFWNFKKNGIAKNGAFGSVVMSASTLNSQRLSSKRGSFNLLELAEGQFGMGSSSTIIETGCQPALYQEGRSPRRVMMPPDDVIIEEENESFADSRTITQKSTFVRRLARGLTISNNNGEEGYSGFGQESINDRSGDGSFILKSKSSLTTLKTDNMLESILESDKLGSIKSGTGNILGQGNTSGPRNRSKFGSNYKEENYSKAEKNQFIEVKKISKKQSISPPIDTYVKHRSSKNHKTQINHSKKEKFVKIGKTKKRQKSYNLQAKQLIKRDLDSSFHFDSDSEDSENYIGNKISPYFQSRNGNTPFKLGTVDEFEEIEKTAKKRFFHHKKPLDLDIEDHYTRIRRQEIDEEPTSGSKIVVVTPKKPKNKEEDPLKIPETHTESLESLQSIPFTFPSRNQIGSPILKIPVRKIKKNKIINLKECITPLPLTEDKKPKEGSRRLQIPIPHIFNHHTGIVGPVSPDSRSILKEQQRLLDQITFRPSSTLQIDRTLSPNKGLIPMEDSDTNKTVSLKIQIPQLHKSKLGMRKKTLIKSRSRNLNTFNQMSNTPSNISVKKSKFSMMSNLRSSEISNNDIDGRSNKGVSIILDDLGQARNPSTILGSKNRIFEVSNQTIKKGGGYSSKGGNSLLDALKSQKEDSAVIKVGHEEDYDSRSGEYSLEEAINDSVSKKEEQQLKKLEKLEGFSLQSSSLDSLSSVISNPNQNESLDSCSSLSVEENRVVSSMQNDKSPPKSNPMRILTNLPDSNVVGAFEEPVIPRNKNSNINRLMNMMQREEDVSLNQSFDCSYMYKAQYKEEEKRVNLQSLIQPVELFKFDKKQDYTDEKGILDSKVDFCGVNLTSTERKLVSIGKALLKKPEILMFEDDALFTDELFESALFDVVMANFVDSCILGILNSYKYLCYFDKVLIIENGEVMEFGDLEDLLRDSTSILFKRILRNDNQLRNMLLKKLPSSRSFMLESQQQQQQQSREGLTDNSGRMKGFGRSQTKLIDQSV